MEDVVRIGLPLGECVGLQHRQSWLRFPPNTDEEVHSCWVTVDGYHPSTLAGLAGAVVASLVIYDVVGLPFASPVIKASHSIFLHDPWSIFLGWREVVGEVVGAISAEQFPRKRTLTAGSDFLFGPNYIEIRGCFELNLSANVFYRAMVYFHFGA